jgi:hypothetical protein
VSWLLVNDCESATNRTTKRNVEYERNGASRQSIWLVAPGASAPPLTDDFRTDDMTGNARQRRAGLQGLLDHPPLVAVPSLFDEPQDFREADPVSTR